MGRKIQVSLETWEEMIQKLREYKSANYFLNKQIEQYNAKYGRLSEEEKKKEKDA